MPHYAHSGRYDILVGFQNIIFIFYFCYHYDESNGIYCLDNLFNKWYKSAYKAPHYINSHRNIYALKDKNNFVHIIDFYTGEHCMLSLNDLIPNKLKKLHLNYYSNLVMRFINDKENNNIIATIPFVLEKLILKYFNPFTK